MTELEATVLIPTHDHGPLVRFPIESALAQTVQQLEVFVVGDGAPELHSSSRGDASAVCVDCAEAGEERVAHRHVARSVAVAVGE